MWVIGLSSSFKNLDHCSVRTKDELEAQLLPAKIQMINFGVYAAFLKLNLSMTQIIKFWEMYNDLEYEAN